MGTRAVNWTVFLIFSVLKFPANLAFHYPYLGVLAVSSAPYTTLSRKAVERREREEFDLSIVYPRPKCNLISGYVGHLHPKFDRNFPFERCSLRVGGSRPRFFPFAHDANVFFSRRFTDEADQQRALIEMHDLYCLSRPMRISPATAKFKPPQADGVSPAGLSTSASAPGMPTSVSVSDQQQQQQSVSAPIAVPSA
ncbi:hypothetical protein B0H14DRAFT_2570173 [Mycena olivaceomarginata]|nr:hypothetical protein B0H14DRAFT_2570173 [Mycena olivaceomarginata]